MASVVELLKSLTNFLKVSNDKVIIDSCIFRAHYHLTTTIFFTGCIFTTAKVLIGDPISCLTRPNGKLPKEFVNPFCWVNNTFTLAATGGIGTTEEGETIQHAYYQWVPCMLFLHGLTFYISHWIWKSCEGGKIKMISDGIRGLTIKDTEERKKKKSQAVGYLIETLHTHNKYAYVYFLCEILNMVNIIVTMYLINAFLNGTFMIYGTKVLKFIFNNQDQRSDPMIKIFPRITKCTINTYGVSGTHEVTDALCVLAVNGLNEKIYIVVWFWLVFLAVLTSIGLAYSIALLTVPTFRQSIVIKRFRFTSGRNASISRLIRKLQIGDFLLLHLLGQNLNTITFHELLQELNAKLQLETDNNDSDVV